MRTLTGSDLTLYFIFPFRDQAEDTSERSLVCLRSMAFRRVRSSVMLKLGALLLVKKDFLWRIIARRNNLERKRTMMGGLVLS